MFKDGTRDRPAAPLSAAQLLEELLQSRLLRPHRFIRDCEIGPFVIDYVCRERSVAVELQGRQSAESRTAFLVAMGYTVIHVRAGELRLRPRAVAARIQAAMR